MITTWVKEIKAHCQDIVHSSSSTYRGPRAARRFCGLCFLCTSPEFGLRKAKWVWPWPRHKPPPGRRRTAGSCCSGCHVCPPAPWKCHPQKNNITKRSYFFNPVLNKHTVYRPAWMPSHVEESLMSTLSLFTPASSYKEMSRRARATMPSLSNDNLKEKELNSPEPSTYHE